MENDLYLTIGQVTARLGVSRCTLYRWISAGSFPAGHQFSAGCRRWRFSDVQAWENSRAARTLTDPADACMLLADVVAAEAA